jgi:uncharacterized MnhB-related membrane protein
MRPVALVLLVILAIVALQTRRLRNSMIYLGLFSMTIAFVYLLYGAPDVAIAEAIIGSTMATVLYIVSFQKYRLFVIYVQIDQSHINDKIYKKNHYEPLLKIIEKYCGKSGVEPLVIYTVSSVEDIEAQHHYSVIIESQIPNIQLYVHRENLKANHIIDRSLKEEFVMNMEKVVL